MVGGSLLVRARRAGQVLRHDPWVAAAATFVEAVGGAGPGPIARFVELVGAPDDGTVMAGPVSARVLPDLVPEAWVAGTGRDIAVAAPGGARSCSCDAPTCEPRPA